MSRRSETKTDERPQKSCQCPGRAEQTLDPLPPFAQDLRTRGNYAVKGNISNEQSMFSHDANVKKKVAFESPVRGDRNTDGGGASEASATPGKAPPTNRTALAVAGKIEDRAFHSVGTVPMAEQTLGPPTHRQRAPSPSVDAVLADARQRVPPCPLARISTSTFASNTFF